MKKILITGGSGFIGSELSRQLVLLNYEVISLGRNKNDHIKIDLLDRDLEKSILDVNPNIVIHLASGSNIKNAKDNPEKEYVDVVLGTKNLIYALKSVQPEKFIYLSSQAIYGDLASPIFEDAIPFPTTEYGKCKLQAEDEIINSSYPYLIFRLSSIYGPSQDSNKSGVVASFISKLESGVEPIVFNDLNCGVDILYIDDVIDCLLQVIKKENLKSDIYNLSSGKLTTFSEILAELYKHFIGAKEPKIIQNDAYKLKSNGIYLSVDKLLRNLSWQPKYNIQDGIRKTVELRKHIAI